MVFGSWAAVRGFASHKSWIPVLVFVLGFVLLVGSHIVEPKRANGIPSGYVELFSVLGGVCLVSFHYINRLYMKTCSR